MKRAALGILVALALFAIAACRNGREGASDVVDTALMAYLSEARALHHQANLKEQAMDLPGATDAMRRLVAAATPHGGRATPEVEEVLADAYARLGELLLQQNELGPAGDAIAKGLEHAARRTYFRGRLLEVEGLVEEARAASLADAGKLEDAVKARQRAIALLEDVVRIQAEVIQRSTEGDGGGAHP